VLGGYTIHHAQGRDKQFVGWLGRAYVLEESGALGAAYLSSFLETVNQVGNIGPGASGSALFDQNNHLVGTLALGRTTTDPSGYGACPVSSAAAPNGSNGVADFTALAAVWRSTADTTSSTGGVTLESALDPAGTGALVVPNMPVALVTSGGPRPPAPRIAFDPVDVAAGQSFTARWSATNAANCTLTGGIPGGTWGASAQTLPPVGSTTESGPAGQYAFGLTCWGADASAAPVSVEAMLTVTPGSAAPVASAAPAPQQGGGGGGALGILEGALLAALLALRGIGKSRCRPRRVKVAARRIR